MMEGTRQKTFNLLRKSPFISRYPIFILLVSPAHATADQLKAVRVLYGDNIKLRTARSKSDITIRLFGIDALETSKKKNEPGRPLNQIWGNQG
jgi:endonuclease YncB( thermonuclease family)